MESFLNETLLQVNEENYQWGEIQKLINIFLNQEISKVLKIISFYLNNLWQITKKLLQNQKALSLGRLSLRNELKKNIKN